MDLYELFHKEILDAAIELVNQDCVELKGVDGSKISSVITIDQIEYPVVCDLNHIESGMYSGKKDGELIFYAASYIEYGRTMAFEEIYNEVNQLSENELKEYLMMTLMNHPELLEEFDQYLTEKEDDDKEEDEIIQEIDHLYAVYDEEKYQEATYHAILLMDEIIDNLDIDDEDCENYLIRLAALLSDIYDDTDECDEMIEKFAEENEDKYSDFVNLSDITDLFDLDDYDEEDEDYEAIVESIYSTIDAQIYVYKNYDEALRIIERFTPIIELQDEVEEIAERLNALVERKFAPAIEFVKNNMDIFGEDVEL